MILAGRRINDGMAKFIAEQTVKNMIAAGRYVKGARVNVLGLTLTGSSRNTLKQHFRSLVAKGHLKLHGSGRGVPVRRIARLFSALYAVNALP